QVSSAGDAQQAMDIARAFVGQSGGGAGGAGASAGGAGSVASGAGGGAVSGAVINAITINGRDQVMVKVTVVEMARSAVKQLGINVTGNWSLLDTAAAAYGNANPYSAGVSVSQFMSGVVGGLGGSGGVVSGQAGIGNNATVGGTLSALERAGVSRVLAEPTLVAISGETANFQVGGEVPTIVTSACPPGQFCPPTVTYKPYGVSLLFTPVVLSEGRISLRVATEVNEIDRETQVNGNFGFRTRKTSTTIELPSGATMATAGLISSQSNQTITGVPGLINLPILGALFRSRDFQRRDSELMVLVTPYIAKPMESAQVARPDDGFQDATDPQTILLGRLNKLYGVAGPGGAAGSGLSGRFGFITD
ncbi:secretin, partial [Enterovirga sp.]|uniref:type II and III secretion system protein family protein n=1 Tax=Enterovirga sp. TaxID=2026350 RepID=UPI002620AB18